MLPTHNSNRFVYLNLMVLSSASAIGYSTFQNNVKRHHYSEFNSKRTLWTEVESLEAIVDDYEPATEKTLCSSSKDYPDQRMNCSSDLECRERGRVFCDHNPDCFGIAYSTWPKDVMDLKACLSKESEAFEGYRTMWKIDNDDCQPKPCQHGGICTDIQFNYTCKCTSGWTGYNCSEDIDECLSVSPCLYGNCNNTRGDYTCECESGWEGKNCSTDINECLTTKPCIHGNCLNEAGSYSCNCDSGWNGANCDKDIDECLPVSPCVHGSCSNTRGDYRCICNSGWEGKNCSTDIDECSTSELCLHGTCINEDGSYTCNCDSGWNGTGCDTDIDECSANPCKNGGTCKNGINFYNCDCQSGYSGDNCERHRAVNIGIGAGVLAVTSLFLVGVVVLAILDFNATKLRCLPWNSSKLKECFAQPVQSQRNEPVEKGPNHDDNVLLSIEERTKFKTQLLEKDDTIKHLQEKLAKCHDKPNRISTALSDDIYFNVITQFKGNASDFYERNELQLTISSQERLKSILNDVFDHLGLKDKHQLKYDVFLGNNKSPIDASSYNKTLLDIKIKTGDTVHVRDIDLRYE